MKTNMEEQHARGRPRSTGHGKLQSSGSDSRSLMMKRGISPSPETISKINPTPVAVDRRTSRSPCYIDLTKSLYGEHRSRFVHDLCDYEERPYCLRAFLSHHGSSTDISSVEDEAHIASSLRVMDEQDDPIHDLPGEDVQQPYRRRFVIFPFRESRELINGRSPVVRRCDSREASSMNSDSLPKELVKILRRREDNEFLAKTLCSEWD